MSKRVGMMIMFAIWGLLPLAATGSPERTDDSGITIGVTTITLQHQFFIDIDEGLRNLAEENGVELLINDPSQDVARQVAAIEDFIQKGVDGMVVISIDGVTAIPAMEDAAAQGVPIVTVDAVVESSSVSAHVGTVNEVAGYELGVYTKEYLAQTYQGPVKIGIVTFLESPIQQQRIAGFKRGIGDASGITYLNPLPGYDREEALNTTEAMLQANPDLDIIYATAENGVIGVKAALESAGNDRVKVVGFDLTAESAEGIRSGTIVAMIQQQPHEMGRIALATLLDIIGGKAVPKSIPTPVLLYDKSNIDEF